MHCHAVFKVNRIAFPRYNNKKRIPFAGMELGRTYALALPRQFRVLIRSQVNRWWRPQNRLIYNRSIFWSWECFIVKSYTQHSSISGSTVTRLGFTVRPVSAVEVLSSDFVSRAAVISLYKRSRWWRRLWRFQLSKRRTRSETLSKSRRRCDLNTRRIRKMQELLKWKHSTWRKGEKRIQH